MTRRQPSSVRWECNCDRQQCIKILDNTRTPKSCLLHPQRYAEGWRRVAKKKGAKGNE
jgi:hypothetical protein